jgi:hypothetical protein
MILVEKIVSGGQTGVDRAALDWAIKAGVTHGGWCPKGRLAEDGSIPSQYDLTETPSDDYAVRTQWNVRDSDATVIMSLHRSISGGTELTQRLAVALGKPWIHVSADLGIDQATRQVRVFLCEQSVKILNVAGPRESEAPDVRRFVMDVLSRLLS